MRKTILLIKTKLKASINRLATGISGNKRKFSLKKSIIIISGAVFLVFMYYLFYRLLNYLIAVPLLGPILILKIISMIFMTNWLMLIYSSIITSFSTFYFSSDLPFLISSPFSFNDIFAVKYLEATLYSSWTIMVIFIPFFLAFGKLYSVNIVFYLLVTVSMIPFFMSASGIGIMAALLMMSIFPSRRTRDLLIFAGVLAGASIYVFLRVLQPEKLLNPETLGSVVNYLSAMQAPSFQYLPSYWITKIMLSASAKLFLQYFWYLGLLVAAAVVLFLINTVVASRLYYSSWAQAQEGSSGSRKENWGALGVFKDKIQRAMLEKDARSFIRDTSQWSQLLLIGALMIVYVFNIYKLPAEAYKVSIIISFLNLAMVGFVLSALSLRFVFPAISIEGSSYWVIKSSPVSPRRLILLKYRMVILPLVLIGLTLVWLSNVLLKVNDIVMYMSLFTVIVMTAGITSIGIGFGALYPNFKVENITQIESSSGGFMCMIISLAYIAVIILIEAVPVRMLLMQTFGFTQALNYPAIIISSVVFILVNTVAIILPLRLGVKNLVLNEI